MAAEPKPGMSDADFSRIAAEIASELSPVGIDTVKTHVMILAKLEAIERRLDAMEAGRSPEPSLPPAAAGALAAATDTFDETVARLAARGVDVDARLRHMGALLERLTDERMLEALGRLADLASTAPHALAGLVDALDDEAERLAERGIDVDAAARNGLHALLYLGQRISTGELESLGMLLRSDVLHPSAVDIVGRLGRALVAASQAGRGSVGPLGAVGRLGDPDARRSTAFLLEFARQFGAALDAQTAGGPSDQNRSTHR